MSNGSFASYEEFFTRPADNELMPVLVRWRTGGSNYDYICAGLAAGHDAVEWQRGNKPKEFRLILWEPQTVIKYNKESGSVAGSATNGPAPGGYGFLLSQQAPAAMGEVLELMPITTKAWEGYQNWTDVAGS